MKRILFLKKSLIIFILILLPKAVVAQSEPEIPKFVQKLVDAMGGLNNYNNVHYLEWEFGKRKLYWDKWTGDLRVENKEENQTVLMNLNTLKGKVFENNLAVEDEQKSKQLLQKAKNWWINDSYWLLMPWKLQDPGVNLRFLKTETLPNGSIADVLELTFENVGATPENKYWVYIDQNDHLIKQWAYYKNYKDAEPKFLKPWDNYQKTGAILLSYNRSKEGGGPRNVVVKSNVDSGIFTQL